MEIAASLTTALEPACEKIRVAGSLRRRKMQVNDIEILLVPKIGQIIPEGKLFPEPADLARRQIETLIGAGILEKRRKRDGVTAFGQCTKLLVHVETKTPVDIFACRTQDWANCLFSRTGGKNTNISVAAGAKARRLAWKPFGPGFETQTGELIPVGSEEDVFRIVGLPYLPPHKRP